MNTDNQNQITEAQVTAWLAEQAKQLSESCGGEYVRVTISCRFYETGVPVLEQSATAYIHQEGDGIMTNRETLWAAMQDAKNAHAPSVRAENLRKKAAALLADAAKLEGAAA